MYETLQSEHSTKSYSALLSSGSVLSLCMLKPYSLNTPLRAIHHYFPALLSSGSVLSLCMKPYSLNTELFIITFQWFCFESVYETLQSEHSTKSYSALLSSGSVLSLCMKPYSLNTPLRAIQHYFPVVLLLSSTFLWRCLLVRMLI